MAVKLDGDQVSAIKRLSNGKILVGGTGSGKSRTAIAYYYYRVCGGNVESSFGGHYEKMSQPRDLYIITTAKKRDDGDWNKELSPFLLVVGENDLQSVNIYVDSWNNIQKYRKVTQAFFIFDEQRLVGTGKWVKSFQDIARKNKWILLTATPGDKWTDYAAVFIANGFYRNITEFRRAHCIYNSYTKHPQIIGYRDEDLLDKHRRDITVILRAKRETKHHEKVIVTDYDRALYRTVWRNRWNPYDDEPIRETGKLFYLLRRVANEHESRTEALNDIIRWHKKVIVFYNFSYELQILRKWFRDREFDIGEWNGEVHSDLPDGERWAYLVQYSAGCEGWNCITTDTIIFYSQTYSYKQTKQAEGRIDRRNTPFRDLYYYKLRSSAPIDLAIARALAEKRDFNFNTFKGV